MEARIMRAGPETIALAALYICESLLLELEEKKILPGKDIDGLLQDAAWTLRGADGDEDNRDGLAASEVIEAIGEQLQRARHAPGNRR